uniref:coiled-coil domain-containing protein 142 isoform X5 n=1 Tax=Pristiophorus japonicus TaxID=55135 RepID=UPI00398E35AB
MSQTSGGFLLPLGPLMGQKRVAPSETESGETEGFSKSSKEESVPKTLELPVTSSTEDKNAAVIEDNNRSQTSVNPLASMPPKESISPEESMHKEKFDHLNGSGPPNSFAKSLQHAETLLWNRLQPSWRWLMTKHQAEDSYSDTDSDDSLLSLDVDNRFPSGRLPEAEQIAFDLGDKQEELEPCSCKNSIQEFCMEDEVLLNHIVDGLVTSNMLWQHVLNRPKPDKPQETEAEDLQLQHTIFSAENNLQQGLEGKQNDEINRNPIVFPMRRKSVRWQDSSHCEGKVLLFSKYKAMMWKAFATHLSDRFYFQPWLSYGSSQHAIGTLDQCKAQITVLLIQVLHEACYKGLLPSDCEPFVKDLCLCMLSRIALIHWDQVFCSALGSALKDKCFPDPERKEDTVRSRTAGLFLELFHPLCVMLTWLNVEQAQKEDARTGVVRKLVVPSILVRTMSHCITTMQTSSHWLMTKGFQFLSSWSMNQFLLVIQGDLKLLRAMASKMLRLAETLCTEEVSSQGIQETLLLAQVTALVKELGDAAAIFNTFSVTALTIFSTNCKRMAIEIFEQSMPVGRQWRVNYRSVELSSKPNEYATAAVQTVIGQVLEGIQPLPEDAQTIPLTAALTAFMEAWMDHILKQKITFSLQGALQLKQDFDMIREFIRSDECQLSMEIRQALLSLHVFHQVDNAIICLLQQPTRKVYIPSNTWEPFRRCCRIGTERERGPRFAAGAWRRRSGARALTSGPGSSSTRTVDFSQRSLNSLDSLDLRAERTRAICQPEASTGSELLSKIRATGHPESYLAVNQQEWLALRADSNRRRKVLRLPCMNKTQEQ